MKYAIFSDVDGTIYSHEQKYHQYTKSDIEIAQSKGIEFIICTGNPFFDNMKNMTDELKANYFIGSNGAFIYDVSSNEVIFKNSINVKEAQVILDEINSLSLGADWWDEKEIYGNHFIIKKIREIISNVISNNKKLKIQDVIDKDILKIEVFCNPNDLDKIDKIDFLENKLKGMDLQLARMKKNHLEITKTNVSKGEAVKWLSNRLSIEKTNIMTIGDSANDHSMLKITDYSYAMGNADELTQSIASLHTSSVEQNGLGEAIKDFIFRNKIL